MHNRFTSLSQALSSCSLSHPPIENYPLRKLTTIKTGGTASLYCSANNSTELLTLIKITHEHQTPLLVVGKGSNLLFSDQGFQGVVISLAGDFLEVFCNPEQSEIIAGAGVPNFKVSKLAKKNHLTEAEFLLTIPGTIGGAIFMNAGAHGKETSELILLYFFCILNDRISSIVFDML